MEEREIKYLEKFEDLEIGDIDVILVEIPRKDLNLGMKITQRTLDSMQEKAKENNKEDKPITPIIIAKVGKELEPYYKRGDVVFMKLGSQGVTFRLNEDDKFWNKPRFYTGHEILCKLTGKLKESWINHFEESIEKIIDKLDESLDKEVLAIQGSVRSVHADKRGLDNIPKDYKVHAMKPEKPESKIILP